MPLTSNDINGTQVYSWLISDREKRLQYFCRDCSEPLSFVDATLKIKHFRHRADSLCQPEPETVDHLYYKKQVFETIRALDKGTAHLEHPVGSMKADVYWEKNVLHYHKVVFEIQASNYAMSDFETKIKYYAHRKNLVVIYLFVGENFLKEVSDNIFTLKEIEKRIFIEKSYLDTVMGAYLDEDKVTIPAFKKKWAKGRSGDCTDRFIFNYREKQTMNLRDFLLRVFDYTPKNRYLPDCDHSKVKDIKYEGKQIRYKIICEVCGKFMGWLPDRTALAKGYSLERTITK